MTYCVGLLTKDGLVMLADTRTNAGIDHISCFRKLYAWETPGERVIAAAAAGNLAITQAVINLVEEGIENPKTGDIETIHTVQSMFGAAQLFGRALRSVYHSDGKVMQSLDTEFSATFLLGGQVAGGNLRLFHIYSAGNFVEATPDTSFFQIGEHKYGKPILDRVFSFTTPLLDCVKLALVSMDSTLRSNLSVGMPCDLLVYKRDTMTIDTVHRIEESDPYFLGLRESWSEALRAAYLATPNPPWIGSHDGA